MTNFNYKITYPKEETLNGGLYDWFGNVLPDFGFPDKKMNVILNDTWPDDNFDRGQVFDLHKWYKTGLKEGIAPFDIDSNSNPIYDWLKDNTPYPDEKVTHWLAVFKRGIQENWIEPHYVGKGLAPEHQGKKLADILEDIPSKIPGIGDMTNLLIATGVVLGLFYGGPIVSRAFKGVQKK